MARVEFKHLTKKIGSKTILDDFNLEIHDEEFLVLVGPSGCGKSTTLRLLAGLEEITSGEIYIGDRLVNRVDPKDRDIAMVFQNYALYPHYTVAQNLAFSLKLRHVSRPHIHERVENVASMLELTELLQRKPKELSGGQRQRVALGRAIIRNPKVFLMDEPLSNLDAKLRVQMRAELMQLQKKLKTTTLYVTHDQVEAMTMGHRMVVLHEGQIQQIGTPIEVYHQPANKFVAGFIGSPPMNFLNRGELTVGVRSEDISLIERPHTEEPFWKMKAQFLLEEPLGGESLYHFSLEDSRWVVRSTQKHFFQVGESVFLSIPHHKIYFFDETDNGQAIVPSIDGKEKILSFSIKKAA